MHIDLDNYLDEIIDFLENEKDYIVVSNYNELDTDSMIQILEERGYYVELDEFYLIPQDDPKLDVKREICDFLGISYHTKKEDVLKLLGAKFRE